MLMCSQEALGGTDTQETLVYGAWTPIDDSKESRLCESHFHPVDIPFPQYLYPGDEDPN